MKRKNRFTIPSKYILFALTLLCVGTMSVSFLTDFDGGILNTVSGYVLIPVQKGINAAGGRSDQESIIWQICSRSTRRTKPEEQVRN